MKDYRDYWDESKEDLKKAKEEFAVFKSEVTKLGKSAGSYISDTGKKVNKKIKAFVSDQGIEKLLLASGLGAGIGFISSGLIANEALKTLLGAGLSVLFGALSIKFIKKRRQSEKEYTENNQIHKSYNQDSNNRHPYGWQEKHDNRGRKQNYYNVDPEEIQNDLKSNNYQNRKKPYSDMDEDEMDNYQSKSYQKPKMKVFNIDEDEMEF